MLTVNEIFCNLLSFACFPQYDKLVLDDDLKITKVEFTTEGRKTPLEEIRKHMLEKHKVYMRINSDTIHENMSVTEVKERIDALGELSRDEHLEEKEMREKLINLERTRNLLVWLDNSTVANHGYLVCLVTCLYDPAAFYTNEEYKVKTGKNVNIQKEIERPELHIIARCSSSDHEQLLYA